MQESIANGKRRWASASAVFLLSQIVAGPAFAEDAAAPVKIAVFGFELEDKSAGAGIIAQDERDTRYLAESTAEAKKLLAASGYTVIDATSADLGSAKQFGLRNCGSCEAEIARKLGAEQALLGVVTRVNRTEFTLLMRITDAADGKVVSQGFTDLRMGANYAWPRGVKWLMDRKAPADKKKSPG
ncbi:MAG TPA: DUF2380 domain-containing protein [Mesorhizobium sp.]|jgi:hypothetical protein